MKYLSIILSSILILTFTLTPINDSNFPTEITPTRNIWLLLSTQSSEGHQVDTLASLAKTLTGLFKFGIRTNSNYPQGSLHLYTDDRDNPIEYKGDFNADDIIKFILSNTDNVIKERSKHAKDLKANQEFQRKEAERAKKQWDDEQALRLKSDTLLLTHSNWDSFIKSRDVFLINFYEANCSQCIELNKEWEAIASELKGKVRVAKINITETGNEALEQQIQIQKYPSIRFYAYGTKNINQFALFEGTKKKFSIIEWVNSKLSQKIDKAEVPILNKENYQTLCKNSKSTCVIFFIENEDADTTTKIEALALKYLKNPISVLVSKKGEQDAFARQVGVEAYPNVVMMYCNRKTLWKGQGLDFKNVDDTIGQITLGNRLGFNKYKFEQELI